MSDLTQPVSVDAEICTITDLILEPNFKPLSNMSSNTEDFCFLAITYTSSFNFSSWLSNSRYVLTHF